MPIGQTLTRTVRSRSQVGYGGNPWAGVTGADARTGSSPPTASDLRAQVYACRCLRRADADNRSGRPADPKRPTDASRCGRGWLGDQIVAVTSRVPRTVSPSGCKCRRTRCRRRKHADEAAGYATTLAATASADRMELCVDRRRRTAPPLGQIAQNKRRPSVRTSIDHAACSSASSSFGQKSAVTDVLTKFGLPLNAGIRRPG
ncbi:MAG: hypothetical protein QM702_03570 [Rubrivivax sp.]